MPSADTDNNLYEVILIESDDDFAVICPGIPGAISQGKDREEALAMIADAMAMCRMYPLPGDDIPERQAELRELGKAKIAELAAECEAKGLEYYVCEVAPQPILPLVPTRFRERVLTIGTKSGAIFTGVHVTNPAPAFYAAAVAVAALGISYGYTYWFAFCPTLLAVTAAALVGTIASDRFATVALSTALFGIVMCVNGALFFSVGLTLLGKELVLLVLFTFLCIVSISLGGLAIISAMGACRRWFSNANAASIIAAVVFANSLIIAADSAAERAGWPLVFDGVGEAIWYGIIPASVAAFSACLVAVIVSSTAVPLATWCRDSGIDHGVSLIVTALAIMASVAAVALAVLTIGGSIASWDILAGGVSLLACALATLVLSVVVWGYRVLLRR